MRLGLRVNLATLGGGILLTAMAALAAPSIAAAQTDIVLVPSTPSARAGKWTVVADGTASGGAAIRHANANAGKITTAKASPTDYFELTFTASANTPYRIWVHGKAESNYWGNDSIFLQFDKSVTSSGSASWRIGTTLAAEMNLEECSGCGLSGWKWQDNGWGRGVLGPVVYFSAAGTQRLRVQTREDGLSIDRILLSPVTYMSSPPPAPGPAAAPPPPAPAGTGTLLKVFDWNTHHGISMNGSYNLSRFVTWIVSSGANVVSLNEVEKNVGSYGSEDQPARYAALLRAATGKVWYYKFAHRDSLTNGQGNLLLSTFPLEDSDGHQLSYSRSVARIQILVNGIRVNVFSTHLDSESSSRRATQMSQLKSWVSSFSQQHIVAGDFNAWPGAPETANMTSTFYDAWAVATANNTEIAYAGNLAGNTRNSRIDYVWYSKSASRLRLLSAKVFNTPTTGSGPSDHRPVMATFEVK